MALSKMQLEIEVDRCLRRFSEALKPSEEYHDVGVRLCEKVLVTIATTLAKTRIQTGQSFSIPVAYYGGTINRYNDPNPIPLEFDILVKVANRQPPFTDVLDFIDTTLRNFAFRLQIAPRTIKVTGYMIQFSFTNGISATIVPAAQDVSQEEIFRQIRGASVKNRRYYSSALMDKQIDFIKQQSFYAHKVGRLAKFWLESMDLQANCVIGAAVMFDLLSIAAVLEEEAKGHGREAVLRAFSRVVELTEKLDVLALGFEREYGQYGPWKVKTQMFMSTPMDGTISMPRLTEPNNPKMNILHGINVQSVEIFKKNGKLMRERLQMLMEKQEYCDIIDPVLDAEGENVVIKRQRVTIQFENLFQGMGDENGLTNNNLE